VKRSLYERLGAPYWIVDADGPSLLALRPVGSRYETEAEVSRKDAFRAEWPLSVQMAVEELER
jgi:hypothetical protein